MASVIVSGDTSGTITIAAPAVAGSGTLTLPVATDTLVGKATTDTLTNKSIAATQLTGTIAVGRLPAGSVLQVVSTTKTNGFTTTSTSLVDVTGLSVSITPSSASNKVLVLIDIRGTSSDGTSNSATAGVTLVRGATSLAVSTAAASFNFTGQLSGRLIGSTANSFAAPASFLDSPATTSSTTYKIQGSIAAGTLYINTSEDLNVGSVSTITVMEIAG